MKLLTSQRNELFDIISDTKVFTPSQFEVTEESQMQTYTATITYKNSDFFFRINYGNFDNIEMSPSDEKFHESYRFKEWYEISRHFEYWLSYLHREISIPDLWENFTNQISNIGLISNFDNSKFTHKEYLEIKGNLDFIRNNIGELPLLREQQNAIIEQLNHLEELVTDLGKFDWRNLFIGTIVGMITQLSVTPENANLLWNLVKQAFSSYFKIAS